MPRAPPRWRSATVAQARLVVRSLVGMRSGTRVSLDGLRGQQVYAAAAIADPESFAVQIRSSGATVQLAAYQDHHEYDSADVRRLVRLSATAGYLVVTEKDAVKLRALWPAEGPEPFVAELEWMWERNEGAVVAALSRVLAVPGHPKRDITNRNP